VSAWAEVLRVSEDITRTKMPKMRFYADFGFVPNKADRELFEQFYALVMFATKAVLELHTVYEDTMLCRKMAAKYPWRDGTLKRSQHLQFSWFLFVNFCYLFEEKYKQAANLIVKAIKPFNKKSADFDVKSALKEIKKSLGPHIRARGQHWHEWHVVTGVTDYRLIETARSFKKFSQSARLAKTAVGLCTSSERGLSRH